MGKRKEWYTKRFRNQIFRVKFGSDCHRIWSDAYAQVNGTRQKFSVHNCLITPGPEETWDVVVDQTCIEENWTVVYHRARLVRFIKEGRLPKNKRIIKLLEKHCLDQRCLMSVTRSYFSPEYGPTRQICGVVDSVCFNRDHDDVPVVSITFSPGIRVRDSHADNLSPLFKTEWRQVDGPHTEDIRNPYMNNYPDCELTLHSGTNDACLRFAIREGENLDLHPAWHRSG